ncbi:asparaginase, partial [Candidatus Micrarchaeota archaeon]|nr:asparaginase [Candidatus Micrarchaeota archaeon]
MTARQKKRIAVVTIGGTPFMAGEYTLKPGVVALPVLRESPEPHKTPPPLPKGKLGSKYFGTSIPLEWIEVAHHPVTNIDSSDTRANTLNKWGEKLVQLSNDSRIDAIVVISGTDKMHRIVTRLAHHLHNLKKPVIFTGSELPMGKQGSSARRHLEQAVRAAYDLSDINLNQVLLLFAKRLPAHIRAGQPMSGEIYHALNALKAHASRPDMFHHSYKRIVGETTWDRGTLLTKLGINIAKAEQKRKFSEKTRHEPTTFTRVRQDLLDVVEVPETKSVKRVKLSRVARVISVRGSGSGHIIGSALKKVVKRAAGRPVVITTEAGAHVNLTSYAPGFEALKQGMIPSGGLIPVSAEIRAEYLAHHMEDIERFARQHVAHGEDPEPLKRKLFAALYLSGAKFKGRGTKEKHQEALGIE